MAIKLISIKCPECNAVLNIEEGRNQAFCSYCGAKVLVNDENEYTFHTIDEAEIKKAETEKLIQLRKMELLEERIQSRKHTRSLRLVLYAGLCATGIIMMIAGFSLGTGSGDPNSGYYGIAAAGFPVTMVALCLGIIGHNNNKNEDDDIECELGIKVKVPESIKDYKKKNYVVIETMLRNAGFTNIQCIPLHDLTVGLVKKPDMVESISINGKNVTEGNDKYAPDTPVIISYHSLPNTRR